MGQPFLIAGRVVTLYCRLDRKKPRHDIARPVPPLTIPPSEADPANNGDGYIDVIEGLPAYGPILVNLDSDLSSNAAGDFPHGEHYTYYEMASRSTLQDEIGTAIKLGRRHIVVHGFAGTVPSTVQTLPGLTASTGNLVLPVACGEIQVVGR